jgi:hypothetical protein
MRKKSKKEKSICLPDGEKKPSSQAHDSAKRPFQWDGKKYIAAERLATGCYSKKDIAESLNISRRTLYAWQCHPEFAAEVKKLVLETGLALRENQLLALKRNAELIGAELTRRLEGKKEISKINTAQLLRNHGDLLRHIIKLTALHTPEQINDSGRVTIEIANQLPTMSDEEIMAYMREQDRILQLMKKPDGCYVPSAPDGNKDEEDEKP